MSAPIRRSVVAVVLLGTVLLAQRAEAGRFIAPSACDTVSTDPLRVRVELGLLNRWVTPLCRVEIEPTSFNGSDLAPILSCTAPAPLSCRILPETGTAVIEAIPCLDDWFFFGDSLTVEVARLDTYFQAKLFIDESGSPFEYNLLWFPCDLLTPVLQSTWGKLKATYR